MSISRIDPAGLDIGQIGGRRNLIINSQMQVAQRGTSSTSGGFQTVDRFEFNASNGDQIAFSQSQATESPDAFGNSYKIDVTTAETAIDADDNFWYGTKLEAQDLQQLDYGSASAQSFTLSFYVRSALTGTYAVWFYSPDGDRSITSTYTINTADTWERKTITIAGDSSGTINNDNGSGLEIRWMLAAGSNYTSVDSTSWGADAANRRAYNHTAQWGTSTSHDFHLTGVQLEVGTVATPFEHRSYGEELALCQRYYQRFAGGNAHIGGVFNSSNAPWRYYFRTTMRAAPTGTVFGGLNSDLQVYHNGSFRTLTAMYANDLTTDSARIEVESSGAFTTGYITHVYITSSGGVAFDAEL